MLRISAELMARMTQGMFFNRLISFIYSNCRNEKLRLMADTRSDLLAIWEPAWGKASELSEHDCALFLMMLAVCACEGIAPGSVDGMVSQIGQNEVRIKNFIAERGYFRFSDFDFPGEGAEEAARG